MGDAGGAAVLRVPEQPFGTASSPGLCGACQVDGVSRFPSSRAGQLLHRGPHSPPGESVGNIHVAKSEPGLEFSPEDEETLVIASARRHRDEQRARAGAWRR